MALGGHSVAELPRLLLGRRQALDQLLQGLLLLLLLRLLQAPAPDLAEALAGLAELAQPHLALTELALTELALTELALTELALAELALADALQDLLHLLLDRLRQVLQRLGALDRMHRVPGHDLVGQMHGRHGLLHRLYVLLLRLLAPHAALREEALQGLRVLQQGGRVLPDVEAADLASDAGAAEDVLAAARQRIEQLGEVGIVQTIHR